MIVMRVVEEMWCPFVFCDACDKPIVGEGLAAWDEHGILLHLHKGRCDRKYKLPLTESLAKHLKDLQFNSKSDTWSKYRERKAT